MTFLGRRDEVLEAAVASGSQLSNLQIWALEYGYWFWGLFLALAFFFVYRNMMAKRASAAS